MWTVNNTTRHYTHVSQGSLDMSMKGFAEGSFSTLVQLAGQTLLMRKRVTACCTPTSIFTKFCTVDLSAPRSDDRLPANELCIE